MAVNPYLEKVLVAYYQRRMRRYLVMLAVCALFAGGVAAWVLLAKPEDGWWSAPVSLVGGPCAFGVLVILVMATVGDRRRILRWLREGRELRAVKRGITEIRRTQNSMVLNRVPTIYVQFNDRAGKIMSIGNLAELDRIEELLRKQMGSAANTART